MTAVTVFRNKFARAWPTHEHGAPGYVLDLGRTLARPYTTDAHFVAYQTSNGRRLSREALDHGVTVELGAFVFDVDCDATLGTPEPPPEAWRRELREKVSALAEQHPDPYFYETRGGARIVYARPTPTPIRTHDDAKQWSKNYAIAVAYLTRTVGIVADGSCSDWQRFFRAPHATRDRGGKPENWPTFGDPKRIGNLVLTPTQSRHRNRQTDQHAVSRDACPRALPARRRWRWPALPRASNAWPCRRISCARRMGLHMPEQLSTQHQHRLDQKHDRRAAQTRSRSRPHPLQGRSPLEALLRSAVAANVLRFGARRGARGRRHHSNEGCVTLRSVPKNVDPFDGDDDEYTDDDAFDAPPTGDDFARGDHVELTSRMLSAIRTDGETLAAEGALYVYNDESGLFVAFPREQQSRIVQSFVGLTRLSEEGKSTSLRIKKHDVTGAIDLARDQVAKPEFFADAPAGIAFSDCFVALDKTLSARPHGQENRARFAYPFPYTRGAHPARLIAFLRECFAGCDDAEQRIQCVREYAGSAIVGIVTR